MNLPTSHFFVKQVDVPVMGVSIVHQLEMFVVVYCYNVKLQDITAVKAISKGNKIKTGLTDAYKSTFQPCL